MSKQQFDLLTSRSQILADDTCARYGLLQDHTGPAGLGTLGAGRVPVAQSVPLAKGSTMHLGFQRLLENVQVDEAVQDALREYDTMTAERGFQDVRDEDQAYTLREQRYLAEVALRLWAVRRLPWFQHKYEVLALERESPVLELAPGVGFQSRPDGVLRDKETGLIDVLSFKTASTWRRTQDEENENDVQGISEPWAVSQEFGPVASVLMEYVVLGQRKRPTVAVDPDESDDEVLEAVTAGPKLQDSFLVRPWRVKREPREEFAWKLKGRELGTGTVVTANRAWDPSFGTRGAARTQSLLTHGEWSAERLFIGDVLPAKEWAARLVNNQVWPFASSVGPLDRLFVWKYYERHQYELDDWRREAGARQLVVKEGLDRLRLAAEGSGHHASPAVVQGVLDTFFPRRRKSCHSMYGSVCSYYRVCWGGDSVNGPKFIDRTLNHPALPEEGE